MEDSRLTTYATPAAFKQALETRLRQAAAKSHVPMNRLRQTLLFERLLVRIFETLGDRAVAKGGVALELRLQRARTTKDLDRMLRGRDDGRCGASSVNPQRT